MTVIMIDRHLEQQLIDLHINRDEWNIITNSALSEKLKKEKRWADRDAEGHYRSEPNELNNESIINDFETIIEQLNKLKRQLQANYQYNLPKRYFCLKCKRFHILPDDFLTHLKFKGDVPEEAKEYYEAVKKERRAHKQLGAYKQLLKRAEKDNVKERIEYHKEKIEALTPGWKVLNEKVHDLRKEVFKETK